MFNPEINSFKRIRLNRKFKNSHLRLDMSERVIPFSDIFFKNFKNLLTQDDFISYPSYEEYDELNLKISEKEQIDSSNILLGTGSDDILRMIFQIMCSKSSNIITTDPCFPMYEIYTKMFGGIIKKIPYYTNLKFNLWKTISEIDNNTKMIVFSNPNSPIGDLYSVEEIRDLTHFLYKKRIFVLLDAAYIDFSNIDQIKLNKIIEEFPNIFIVKTFSKALGSAGIRIGYCLSNKNNIFPLSQIQPSRPIPTTSLKFAQYILNNFEEVEKYILEVKSEREEVVDILSINNFDVINSNSNWIHFNNKNDNKEIIEIFKKNKILFKNCNIPYDNRKNWIRLTIFPSLSNYNFFKEIINKNA